MGADYNQSTKPPVLQDPGQVTQAAPAQNVWYNAINGLQNVRVVQIMILVAGVGETLECEVISDGVTWGLTPIAAVAGTNYVIRLRASAVAADPILEAAVDQANRGHAFLMEGRANVTVRVRKTTLNGAGDLHCKVLYELY